MPLQIKVQIKRLHKVNPQKGKIKETFCEEHQENHINANTEYRTINNKVDSAFTGSDHWLLD